MTSRLYRTSDLENVWMNGHLLAKANIQPQHMLQVLCYQDAI